MSNVNLIPYINFNGTAGKAIRLYESVLGATTESIMRYGDHAAMNAPAELKDHVLHAHLRIGNASLMLSDPPPDRPVAMEGNVSIFLDFASTADLTNAFEALAKGGTVTLPPQDTFWGAKFGMLTDSFGVRWIFNCKTE